eukprot:TRINITY_DN60951_c0_g1_i2.p2 TRINITY_DN60951_c0_g1~~TRINITY_DN60951_c0_g1_i2.p2  ORF type:complete len:134 (-),score=24.31 TRINITY_DN60951_c0_g1_i2:618-1019(-)
MLIYFASFFFFFFQAEDGIRDAQESRGLGDVYKRQVSHSFKPAFPLIGPDGPLPVETPTREAKTESPLCVINGRPYTRMAGRIILGILRGIVKSSSISRIAPSWTPKSVSRSRTTNKRLPPTITFPPMIIFWG